MGKRNYRNPHGDGRSERGRRPGPDGKTFSGKRNASWALADKFPALVGLPDIDPWLEKFINIINDTLGIDVRYAVHPGAHRKLLKELHKPSKARLSKWCTSPGVYVYVEHPSRAWLYLGQTSRHMSERIYSQLGGNRGKKELIRIGNFNRHRWVANARVDETAKGVVASGAFELVLISLSSGQPEQPKEETEEEKEKEEKKRTLAGACAGALERFLLVWHGTRTGMDLPPLNSRASPGFSAADKKALRPYREELADDEFNEVMDTLKVRLVDAAKGGP